MADGTALDVVLLRHMHRPDNRDRTTGGFALPWAYLHALEDYTDPVAQLDGQPGVRAVVNFVPVLLDQIEDYAEQFAGGTMKRAT